MLGQRYLTSMQGARRPDGPSDYENSVVLQFELKGLSGSERRSGQWWTRPIPGYRNRF